MKYLGVFISIVLVSSCVVMTKNDFERQNECKVKFYGEYWGDCYIEITESDPAFSFQISNSVGIDRWNLLKLESRDLKKAVDNKVLTVTQANNRFVSILGDLGRIEQQKNAQTQEQLKALSDSLGRANNILNGRTSTKTSVSQGQTGYLEDEYVSGFNKICVYSGVSGKFTKTISSVSLCPISATQD